MGGIYFHIPFCKKACIYCDFHFSTATADYGRMAETMLQELHLRSHEISGPLSSVYFGGGTPSLLHPADIKKMIEAVHKLFGLTANAEVTLEANPDDISEEILRAWKSAGINRLSVGLQSFDDVILRWMNRAHNAAESISCLQLIKSAGFTNFTADLIYGVPGQSLQNWIDDLYILMNEGVPHFSAYCLTVEHKTALAHHVKTGKATMPADSLTEAQYLTLCEIAAQQGFEHYEISNFAKPGFRAIHNASYWKGFPYLGIGPSAHSFDGGRKRYANIANNARYMNALESGELAGSPEILTDGALINENVITRLRTKEGLPESLILEKFGTKALQMLHKQAKPWIAQEILTFENGYYFFTEKNWLTSDAVLADLMQV